MFIRNFPEFWEYRSKFMIIQYCKGHRRSRWFIYRTPTRTEFIMGPLIIGFGNYDYFL